MDSLIFCAKRDCIKNTDQETAQYRCAVFSYTLIKILVICGGGVVKYFLIKKKEHKQNER